ncbi:hypothetical protein [Nocardia sp. R6R-6]|uniref:hypothetical protein n=1 Tax=Nocardia sp. R6R-6 TaxID=3459303 RepID=UPI00403DC30A
MTDHIRRDRPKSPRNIPAATTGRMADRGYPETAQRDTLVARPASAGEATVLGVATGTILLDHLRTGRTAAG